MPLLVQFIRLQAHHLDHFVKSIRLDNAKEFTSYNFDNYCMSIEVDVKHHVPHIYIQNGLAETTIKKLQMVAWALVMHINLSFSTWGYIILNATLFISDPLPLNFFLNTRWSLDISWMSYTYTYLVARFISQVRCGFSEIIRYICWL